MTNQFESYGFEDLRTYLQNNWAYIAIVDDGGTEVLRWDANNNSNISWTSGPSTNPLSAEITITGQDIIDAGGSLPVTLARTETYMSSSATSRTSYDPISNATIDQDGDQVTVHHDYSLPP